jgi:hypothetical protein
MEKRMLKVADVVDVAKLSGLERAGHGHGHYHCAKLDMRTFEEVQEDVSRMESELGELMSVQELMRGAAKMKKGD